MELKSNFRYETTVEAYDDQQTDLRRRGDLAKAPNENICFRQSSPLALAADVW